MSKQSQLILWGAGGHAKVVLDAIDRSQFKIAGCVVNVEVEENQLDSIPIHYIKAPIDWFEQCVCTVFVAIGDNTVRRKCLTKLMDKRLPIPTIISKTACVSGATKIGTGSFVGHNAIVNSAVILGVGCIVNSGAIVEHDCRIGDHSHVSSGVVLGGHVHIGLGSLIGLGARVLPGVKIGDNAIIGAGSVVTKDVPSNQVYCGIPARPLRNCPPL